MSIASMRVAYLPDPPLPMSPNNPALRYARFGPFELARIESCDFDSIPSLGRLRLAVLLIYSGLLLTLSGLV